MIHRSFLNQLADYQFVAETLRRLNPERKRSVASARNIDQLVRYCTRALITRAGELSYFKLHNLSYLLEYENFKRCGERLSNAYIIRQKDGPYVTNLHVSSLKRAIEDVDVRTSNGQTVLRLRSHADLFRSDGESRYADAHLDALIDSVWSRYGSATNEQLKSAVYLTAPMRELLRAEKYKNVVTFNQPVVFGAH